MQPKRIVVVILCALVMLLDGFDTQSIGYIAPALVVEFGVNRTALAPIFSVGLFGLMIGALLAGPLADAYGRKTVLLFCVVAFGFFSLLSLTAHSVGTMVVWRFPVALGLGGSMPNSIALIAELAPAPLQNRLVTLSVAFFSIGAAIGGFLSAVLIPEFGWRSVILFGGLVPLLLGPLLWGVLPESKLFLDGRRFAEQIRLPRTLKIQLKMLFAEERRALTICLWIGFFANLILLFFLANYLPLLLKDEGLPLSASLRATALYQTGGVIGAIAIGALMDRFKPPWILGLAMLGAAAFTVLIPFAGHDLFNVCFYSALAGFCVIGGQIGANSFAGISYPTEIRATGLGWALGIGRLGSVTGPVVVTALLTIPLSIAQIFFAAAIAAVIAAIAFASIVLFLPRSAVAVQQ